MRRPVLVPVLLCALAVRAAADVGRAANPDRWTTVEIDESGMAPWKSDQIVYAPGKPETDSSRQSLDAAASISALFPLTDAFSLTLGLGGDWSEAQTANAGAAGSTAADSSQLTYRAGGRWYFEDDDGAFSRSTRNPDRWASLGLNVSGAQLLNYSAGTSAGNTAAESASNGQTGALDLRLPVSDAWTLTVGAGGVRSESENDNGPGTPKTVSLVGSVSASAGARYFLLDRNLILNDGHLNPDVWTMLYATASGSRSVYGRQAVAAGRRDIQSRSESVTAGVRVPVTDRMSLAFSGQLQYQRSYAPPLGAAVGTLTRTATVTFTAGVRWFVF